MHKIAYNCPICCQLYNLLYFIMFTLKNSKIVSIYLILKKHLQLILDV